MLRFENGELDLMKIDSKTYNAALDPAPPFDSLLYVSPYGGLSAIKLKWDYAPLEDLFVRKALAYSLDMEEMVKTVWGPTAVSAKGLISSHVPCHNSDADPHPYDPDLARQFLSDSSYGGVDNLPALMIDLSRPEEAELSRLMRRNWWKSNLRVELGVRDANDPLGQRNLGFILGVDLEAHELERRTERRGYVQFHHITAESWTPDPSQIVSSLPPYVIYEATLFRNAGTGYPVLLRVFDSAMSMPLDDPDRCAVFQAYEEEYLDRAHVIPIREVDPVRWLVQPWLVGFQSTFNQDFNTLTSAYVVRH